MTYSGNGLNFTEKEEELRLHAYQDIVGVWTIGYGHTKDVQPGQIISQEQAQQFLQEDIKSAESAVNDLVDVPLNQNEFDALVDFVFNVGEGNFENSTLLKLLNQKDYSKAAVEFARWSYASGKVVSDLLKRRIAEEEEFVDGLNEIQS